MSIKTTKHIPRKQAILRIRLICSFIQDKDYKAIESVTFEPNEDIQQFVDNSIDFDISSIDKWTNKMIEDILDKPFFRLSMFDNYFLK